MPEPWICPDCGSPNNGGICTKCAATPPVDARSVEPVFWFQGLRHGDPLSRMAARVVLSVLVVAIIIIVGPCMNRP